MVSWHKVITIPAEVTKFIAELINPLGLYGYATNKRVCGFRRWQKQILTDADYTPPRGDDRHVGSNYMSGKIRLTRI